VTASTTRPIPADFELFERACGGAAGCGGRIMWAKTNASGRREWMPLDYEPSPRGNVLAYPAPDNPRLLVCDVLATRGPEARRLDGMRRDGWLTFTHHRMSCPRADQWARAPKSMRPAPSAYREPPAPVPDPEPEGLF
jgi:hypothetical protein